METNWFSLSPMIVRVNYTKLNTFSPCGYIRPAKRSWTPYARVINFTISVKCFINIITLYTIYLHCCGWRYFLRLNTFSLYVHIGPALGRETLTQVPRISKFWYIITKHSFFFPNMYGSRIVDFWKLSFFFYLFGPPMMSPDVIWS